MRRQPAEHQHDPVRLVHACGGPRISFWAAYLGSASGPHLGRVSRAPCKRACRSSRPLRLWFTKEVAEPAREHPPVRNHADDVVHCGRLDAAPLAPPVRVAELVCDKVAQKEASPALELRHRRMEVVCQRSQSRLRDKDLR